MKALTPVLVEALDLTTHQNWHPPEHADEAQCFSTVACGMYVSHDKEVFRLTQMVTHDMGDWDAATETLVIPLGCIKRVRRLKQ